MSDEVHDLQARIAFQEDLLQTLDARVAEQEKDIAAMNRQMQLIYKKLKVVEEHASQGEGGDPGGEPPPPHY